MIIKIGRTQIGREHMLYVYSGRFHSGIDAINSR